MNLEFNHPTIVLANTLIITVSILISVAFYTMLERKLLSYIQLRKGPNKVGITGLLQPFSDALKLFNKTTITPSNSNTLLFLFTPLATFLICLMIWPCLPLSSFNLLDSPLNSLILILISSLTVYSILMTGWASNSKYSHLGAIRSVAQMISYEINFFIMILTFLMLSHSYNLYSITLPQNSIWLLLGLMPLFTLWTITCLAEVNRSPFDFAESESELVSGFNTEYMGGPFALIFLGEYTNMLILTSLSTLLFTGTLSSQTSMMFAITFALTLIWARGTLPRFRYDILMSTNWKHILPSSTFVFLLISTFTLTLF